MSGIEIYLEKFKKIKPPDDSLKRAFVSLLSEKFGIKIELEDIKISRGRIYVDADPMVKSRIYVNMESILSELGRVLQNGEKSVI